MFVKICGITTEDDGLLAVALGADALGFVFAPSSRQVAVDRARDIVRRLPPEILTVGVFRDDLPDRVVDIVQRAGLGAAQLHGHETAEQTRQVRARIPLVIKGFPAGHPGLSHIPDYGADVILVEGETPGSGEVFDWRLAEDAPRAGHRVLLAGGLHPGNVADGIRQVRPWGVDVSSGVEREPGRKDPVKLREFIDAARVAGDEVRRADPDYDEHDDDGAPYDWQDDF
ncbi:MAG: phosphoribosylanthranilate isomerase [Acidimicrobiales bacterium]